MTNLAMSRRSFVGAGACAIAATAGLLKASSAKAATALSLTNEETVRKYYKLWETKDWHPLDILLADDFTFTSAAGDDHISKSAFKAQCWDTQIDHIARFDLLQISGSGNTAFVLYDGFTKNNKSFRNVEYMHVKGGQVEAIECYFGGKDSFASAISTGQK